MPSEITLSDNTSAAIAAIEGGAQRFIEAVAVQIRDQFQADVHVDTGAMQASASVVTPDSSDYDQHVAAAAALNPKAAFAPEEQVGPNEAVVQVPVDYAGIEEFGSRFRPGHPALVPAVEQTIADAENIAKKVFGL